MNDYSNDNLLLGKQTTYITRYTPSLLCPIKRSTSRKSLGITAADGLPFFGADIWTAYELSWLSPSGKPEVACAEITFPAASEAIIESKSLKLYFNSFNQSCFDDRDAVAEVIATDLSHAVNDTVQVKMMTASGVASSPILSDSILLDNLAVEMDQYQPDEALLELAGGKPMEENLHSHLLRSLCPVTGQPDWASLFIHYRGQAINHDGLLKYIISYREHQDFHEHCVERIFMDITKRCRPEQLTVYARYLRRGGLDINPYRSSKDLAESPVRENLRLYRQ
jgi:7-cyano-7-deazaguanine reductase